MSEDALAETATAAESPAAVARVERQLGRYKLERELGAGGMGVVHCAFDPELERRVALKVLLRAGSPDARQRFLREARALAKLEHPNVVGIYEIGSVDGRDFIAMELVDGTTLADWLRERRRYLKEILEAFVAAGRGLAAAHEAGIVHRDFKPHNVLRGKDGRILVTDFGLARAAGQVEVIANGEDTPQSTTLTATGSWVGTPAYMAPEQWRGGEVTPATDQFAFCVALWEALVDQRPFRGDTTDELRAAVERGITPKQLAAAPSKFRAILKRGLDPDPAKRWPSMRALLDEITRTTRSNTAIVAALCIVLGGGAIVVGWKFGDHVVPDFEFGEPAAFVQSDGAIGITSYLVTDLLAEIRSSSAARIVPAVRDGKPIGFRISEIKRRSTMKAVGFKNGDVLVAIDGFPLVSSNEDIVEAIAKIPREPKQVRFDLVRDGQPRTIVVRQIDI